MRVLNIIHGLSPLRVVKPLRGGHSVIELAAGKYSMVGVGDELNLELNDSASHE